MRQPIVSLTSLVGTWKGRGLAVYPTIEATEYLEETKFELIEEERVMFFEQRTWHVESDRNGAPLHFESGYIIAKQDGTFELVNSQNNGRTEVMSGIISMFSGDTFHLALESKSFSNDDRMIRTTRDIYIDDNVLKYYVNMATKITPKFQHHLEATLMKTA